MKKVFDEVKSLDKRAINSYFLSEELLMEHASLGIQNYIFNWLSLYEYLFVIWFF